MPLTVAGAASASTRVLVRGVSYRVPIFIGDVHEAHADTVTRIERSNMHSVPT